MLTYSDENRQQLIVRQSCMNRAVDILVSQEYIKTHEGTDVLKAVEVLTNKLEQIILNK